MSTWEGAGDACLEQLQHLTSLLSLVIVAIRSISISRSVGNRSRVIIYSISISITLSKGTVAADITVVVASITVEAIWVGSIMICSISISITLSKGAVANITVVATKSVWVGSRSMIISSISLSITLSKVVVVAYMTVASISIWVCTNWWCIIESISISLSIGGASQGRK